MSMKHRSLEHMEASGAPALPMACANTGRRAALATRITASSGSASSTE